MASCAGMKPPESRWQSERGKVPLNHRPGGGPVPHGQGSRYRAPIAFDYSRRNKKRRRARFPLILRKKSQGVSCDPATR